jgi:ABC-type branched-subunit amino acid transport system ATPase component
MRIHHLSVQAFKNLRDVSVDFDEHSWASVVLGRNGAGKSNLLEALVIIFRDLDLHRPPTLSYKIRYRCREHIVEIDADRERLGNHTIAEVRRIMPDSTWGEPVRMTFRQLTQTEGRPYLPQYVFGYYSGPSNRLEKHFERHQDQFYRALIAPFGAQSIRFAGLFSRP